MWNPQVRVGKGNKQFFNAGLILVANLWGV